jgi:hypothetical protein
LELHIGFLHSGSNAEHLFIDSAGWLAAIGAPVGASGELANPFGALAAGCLGVAELFKRAVNSRYIFEPYYFDVFSLKTSSVRLEPVGFPGDLAVGKTLMIGAGSVASAFAYCARILRFSCDLTAIDHDIVKILNFNRSPIFGKSTFELPKPSAIEAFLDGSGINVRPYSKDFSAFLKEFPGVAHQHDIWLPLANEFNVRWIIQNNFPPLMVHGSTSSNWAVNFGRHIPGIGDCLVDRYPVETAPVACSKGAIAVDSRPVDAALPFLSFFAGLLIAADLVRLKMPGYPHVPNFAQFGFSDRFISQAFNREGAANCICRQQTQAVWEKVNGSRGYAHLNRRPQHQQ